MESATLSVLKPRKTHGLTGTMAYQSWIGMRQRCHNPNAWNYGNYGGRGIQVCERWLESFENFFADMGERPSKQHSLGRINNDGGYSPDNCRWATQREQTYNTSANTLITYAGKTLNLLDWSRPTGISVKLLRSRCDQGLPPATILHLGHLPKHPRK